MDRVFAYARVSTRDQNLDRQIVELAKFVPRENIVIDKASGKNTDRPGYLALKGALGLRSGDILYIKSLDRLSRNKSDIKHELEWFREHKIRVKILDLPTSMIEVPAGNEWIIDMVTNILIEVLASVAEQERISIRCRQKEGIAAAKAKGKHLGRPPLVVPMEFSQVYDQWKSGEITAKKAIDLLGMSKTSFYRTANRYTAK